MNLYESKLTIRPLEEKKHRRHFSTLEIQEDQIPEMMFEENKVKEVYFDRYEGVQSEISQVTKFDESTDLSTTYLGRINQTRKSVIRAEESFPISGQGYIHDNIDLVLGMKNAYELEAIIGMRYSSFRFLNRSIPFFSKEQTVVKPKEKKFIKIEAPFINEIWGHAIVKMLDIEGQCTVVLKLKFVRNCASVDVTNNTQETVIFDLNQMIGILDLRSLGYYKIKQGVLDQNLSKCYHFESVEKLCEEFNAIVNERKKEEENEVDKDKYP